MITLPINSRVNVMLEKSQFSKYIKSAYCKFKSRSNTLLNKSLSSKKFYNTDIQKVLSKVHKRMYIFSRKPKCLTLPC